MSNTWQEAIAFAERALQGENSARSQAARAVEPLCTERLPLDRPTMGKDFAYLVSLLDALGLYNASQALLEHLTSDLVQNPRALDMDEAGCNQLAVTLADRGHLATAAKLLADSARSGSASATTLVNLASVMLSQDDSAGAADCAARARRAAGPAEGDQGSEEWLDIQLLATGLLVATARRADRHAEADQLVEELEGFARDLVRLLGNDHPKSVSALVTLASAEFESAKAAGDLERMERAADVIAIAAQRMSATLGIHHPRSISALRSLATVEYESVQALAARRGLHSARALVATATQRAAVWQPRVSPEVQELDAAPDHFLAARESDSHHATALFGVTQYVSKAVGIDLGTTNSAVAVMNPTDTDIVIHRDAMNARTTPSCVWRNPNNGELVVGRKAFARVGSTPEPVTSVKRLMGSPGTVKLAENEERTPVEISAEILREMKRQIEQDVTGFGTPDVRWVVDRAVITVPAYFDQPQIDATRQAAEAAGLRVVDLLHEPTAAAIYYCWRTGTRDGTFLVYDLGGGTFDVSVVRCKAADFRVLGISGNTMLGGDDIDTALAGHLQQLLRADDWAMDLDLKNSAEDRLRFRQLKTLAESVKKGLSDRAEFMLRDSGGLSDKDGQRVVIDTVMERAQLEQIARPLLERTFQYCDEALDQATREAGVTLADIDQVILAGGSTHLPLVREMVRSRLCSPAPGSPAPDSPRARCTEPVYEQVDTVVALGAAVRASAVGGLDILNEERTVQVGFRGTGVTAADRTVVGGTVEALDPDLDLTDGSVRLTTEEYEDEAQLKAGGSFAFTRIPIQPDAQSLLTLEVFDAEEELLATVGRAVVHDRDAGAKPVGNPTSAAINAKEILLEVKREGRTVRDPLIPALRSLPFKNRYGFSHPGDKSTVEFRLFQQARPIQVIRVPVPSSTPRGTAIDLDVEMDMHSLITVRGSIGDHPFEALVEVPPETELPSDDKVAELLRAFGQSVEFLPAGEQNVQKAKMEMAKAAFTEALSRGENAVAGHEFEEMQAIADVTGNAPTGDLQPPRADFEKLVKDCGQLNRYVASISAEAEIPHDDREITQAVEVQRDHGERALSAGDQRSYSEVITQLQHIFDHLRTVAYRHQQENEPVAPAEVAASRLQSALEMLRHVRNLAQGSRNATADHRRQVADIGQRLDALQAVIAQDPHRVQQEAAQDRQRLIRLKTILTGSSDEPGGVGIPEALG
ncbi:Hsp70 family protein [Streptomyces sp. NBC_00038]|uniref:Hsp70 family protein n=1 Tax=Streptomyces sp. NBC_00038 TaxID=2903615 RepID=UPI00224CD558|nr:Hsp70 family protein [Streptomyces sp. NBC_00038]MCX5559530.1 Hsp70 family protein [Streptomyces sp. NBC_00038]